MNNFFRQIFAPERRWLLISIIVGIGAVIIFNVIPRGSSGGQRGAPVDTGPSEQLQAAQLQAQTQLALSGQAAQVQMSGQAAELASREMEGQIALALGSLQAGIEQDSISAQLAAMQYQTQSDQTIAAMNAEIALAGIDAQARSEERMYSTQQAMFEIQAEQNLARDMLFTELQRAQSEDETARLMAMLQSQRDVQIADIYGDVERDRIRAETEQAELRYGDRANDRAARSRDRSNRWGFAGSLLSAGLAFFSDARLKENIKWLGVRDDGLNMYSYNYRGETDTHSGFMAQEVQAIAPGAYMEAGGYGVVNYGRLA